MYGEHNKILSSYTNIRDELPNSPNPAQPIFSLCKRYPSLSPSSFSLETCCCSWLLSHVHWSGWLLKFIWSFEKFWYWAEKPWMFFLCGIWLVNGKLNLLKKNLEQLYLWRDNLDSILSFSSYCYWLKNQSTLLKLLGEFQFLQGVMNAIWEETKSLCFHFLLNSLA